MNEHRRRRPWSGKSGPKHSFETLGEGATPASGADADPVVLPEAAGATPPGSRTDSGPDAGGPPGDLPGDLEPSPVSTRDDAEAQAADYLNQLQRLKAEFDNYRKRTAREREEWFLHAQAEMAAALLPVLDDARRAREHELASEASDPDGRQLILKRFEDTLEKLGLEKQRAEPGTEFDPEQHDAVMAEPSAEIPEGMILRVLEPGYLFRGRLLRRSRVCYSSGPAGE
jgi:molecular chaperone GrpE